MNQATVLIGGMIADWIEANSGAYAAGEAAFGGLDKAGLIAIIIISVIAIAAFVWIFHETRKRD